MTFDPHHIKVLSLVHDFVRIVGEENEFWVFIEVFLNAFDLICVHIRAIFHENNEDFFFFQVSDSLCGLPQTSNELRGADLIFTPKRTSNLSLHYCKLMTLSCKVKTNVKIIQKIVNGEPIIRVDEILKYVVSTFPTFFLPLLYLNVAHLWIADVNEENVLTLPSRLVLLKEMEFIQTARIHSISFCYLSQLHHCKFME